MTRRQRSLAATAVAWAFGLGLVAWDAVHGRWATVAWYVGSLVVLIAFVLVLNAWIDRGKP